MRLELKMKPTSVIKTRLGIQPKGPVHKFFTNTCALHMDKYMPHRTGTLAGTVVQNGRTTSNVSADVITYAQEYAIYPYQGVTHGKEMNYTKDFNSLAGPYWDKRMWSAEKDTVVKEVQNYIATHGGKK